MHAGVRVVHVVRDRIEVGAQFAARSQQERAEGDATAAPQVHRRRGACASADDLEQAAVASFNQHPDAGIITSFPGLGALTGARVLAEIGDDRSRFQDAKGLKAYAGAAPVTRASGKTKSVTHRKVKNNRLSAVGYTWAFSALTASPGARARYDPAATPATSTPAPCATCSAASSAACTTA